MSFDLDHLRQLAQEGPFARIVVTRTAGSVPREAGTSMIVWADKTYGTIGGGALEYQAMAEARALLTKGGAAEKTYPLGPGLGQCCGGAVTLVTEVFDQNSLPDVTPFARRISGRQDRPKTVDDMIGRVTQPTMVDGWLIEAGHEARRPLWIWGSGHVGRALVSVLAPLPDFRISWIDIAPERFPDAIPSNVDQIIAAEPPALARFAPQHAEHLILTHSHTIDLALCHALIKRGFGEIGLIGSDTKWARFKSRLRDLGCPNDQTLRIRCPIGQPELGKHPQAIALGVATELIADSSAPNRKEQIDRGTA